MPPAHLPQDPNPPPRTRASVRAGSAPLLDCGWRLPLRRGSGQTTDLAGAEGDSGGTVRRCTWRRAEMTCACALTRRGGRRERRVGSLQEASSYDDVRPGGDGLRGGGASVRRGFGRGPWGLREVGTVLLQLAAGSGGAGRGDLSVAALSPDASKTRAWILLWEGPQMSGTTLFSV